MKNLERMIPMLTIFAERKNNKNDRTENSDKIVLNVAAYSESSSSTWSYNRHDEGKNVTQYIYIL